MSKLIDLTGSRFGRLKVIHRSGSDDSMNALWLCQCDCGTATTKNTRHLRKGLTRSCGCLRRETTRARATTHGLRRLPEYMLWLGMKDRCYNKNNQAYRHYGGKGVKVCARWRDDFAQFFADMGPRQKGLSLDRIDSNGDYSPENCRWATWTQQTNNTSQNRWLEHEGERLTFAQWCHRLGWNESVIGQRIKRGWTPREAICTPLRKPTDPRKKRRQG